MSQVAAYLSEQYYNNVTPALCLAALVAGYIYYKNVYGHWSRMGVKGPRPIPLAGNFAQMLFSDRVTLDLEWAQKYGKVYGIYQGTKPALVVSDPDVMRQICIKDFDKFPNHDRFRFANKFQKNFLINIRDEHWKRVRAMMSPTFTSGKIRRMYKLLQVCSDDLVQTFNEQLEAGAKADHPWATLNLKDVFSLFTMDAIASCCYGLKLERQGANNINTASSRNEFVRVAMQVFKTNVPRILVSISLPKPLLSLVGFETQSQSKFLPLSRRVEQYIKVRRESGKKFDDYLQILLDAKFDDKMELELSDDKENHHAGITSETLRSDHEKMVADVQKANKDRSNSGAFTKVELTEQEILSNAIFLLIVGLETTSSLLTHVTYILGFNHDVQERLYQEIKLIARRSGDKFEFDYDELTSCQYLDAVISETLRILTPVFYLDRYVEQDYYIEKYNIQLKKGWKINMSYYAAMNDPDYWPEPRKFDPERFMPENRDKIYPGSYCPFGLGPRHCIGMRFSLTETKLALAKVLMNYRFDRAPNTEFPPKATRVIVLNAINKPIGRVSRREA